MGETEGETGFCSDRWGHASKSLIQLMGEATFPPCCLTWGQTMVEVMKIMAPPSKGPLQPFCTQWPQPCSRPLLTHASAGDSWTLMGKSGSVSSGVTAPFSWVRCTQSSVCALQESVSPDCVSSDSNMVGLCHTQVCCIQPYPRLLHPEPLSLWLSAADHLIWPSCILLTISAYHLAGASLPLDIGYLLTVAPVTPAAAVCHWSCGCVALGWLSRFK